MSHRESTFLLDLDVGDLDADLTGVGAAIEAAASPAARDGDADQDLPGWVFDPELDGAVMVTHGALKTPGMFFVGPCCAGACVAKGAAAHNNNTKPKTPIDGARENLVVAPATGPRCARGWPPFSSHASVA